MRNKTHKGEGEMAEAKLMQGKRGLVMGVANDHSIAWGIARMLASHGAEIAFTYQGEAQAKRLRPLAQSIGSQIVMPADVENDSELDAAFDRLNAHWGELDFLVHVGKNVGIVYVAQFVSERLFHDLAQLVAIVA